MRACDERGGRFRFAALVPSGFCAAERGRPASGSL